MIGRAVKDLGTAVLQMGESSSVASSWRQEAGAALPEASVPAHSLRPLCSSYRLGLARRLARLDRSGHYELKRSEASPEMFDFQESAARWLVRRFEIAQGYSLLEMAAGCGKTRALGAFLAAALPPSELCLYITQAGLVRQTCAELQRVFPRLPCFRAESSKDLKNGEPRRSPRGQRGYIKSVAPIDYGSVGCDRGRGASRLWFVPDATCAEMR